MGIDKTASEIIDSYLYALVKKKGYTKEDLIDALKYIVSGKVEYKGTGNHPLEQLGIRNMQKELFKSIVKKSTLYTNNRKEHPLHSMHFLIMESIEKWGVDAAFEKSIENQKMLEDLAENYILDHFEFEDGQLFYSSDHEDMNQFMTIKACENILATIDKYGLPKQEDLISDFLSESNVEKEQLEDNLLSEELMEDKEDHLELATDMERLEYCLSYMQKKANYTNNALVGVIESALDGNYKVFTRENDIRRIVEDLPREVLENKKALLLMEQMEKEAEEESLFDI